MSKRFAATINGWCFDASLDDNSIVVTPYLPEHPRVEFTTTGKRGGDAGHGGWASLTARCESGVFEGSIDGPKDSIERVTILGRGDWELTGLAAALALLGRLLERAGIVNVEVFGERDALGKMPVKPEPAAR